eukprot:COSAG01_NODE_380_length_17862_cov_20.427212_16_plen_86_part_00
MVLYYQWPSSSSSSSSSAFFSFFFFFCHNVAADESAHGASWTCGTFVALALPGILSPDRARQRFEQSLLLMSTPGAASLPTGLVI